MNIPHIPRSVGTCMPNARIRQKVIIEAIHIGRYILLYKLVWTIIIYLNKNNLL